MTKDYYTTHEVSEFCNVYPTTVINWINEELLPAFTTPGGHRRIKRADLIKLMKRNNMPIPPQLIKTGKSKVLIIDDDPKILKLVKIVLEAEKDLKIKTATNGFEAGAMVYEFMPDVILLDFLMPEMDGFEVSRRLKKDEKTKRIPIIAITVLRDEKEIKKMYDSGITDYIAKPFKVGELIEKIRKCIPERLR